MPASAIAKRFGRAASSYDAASQLQQQAAQRLLERLISLPPALPVSQALDAGCATGRQAEALTQAFPTARFLAVDNALPMLQQAQAIGRCGPHYQPLCADVSRLPLADNSLQLVFSSFALQWTRPGDVLAELGRVLQPGGRIALALPLPESLAEMRASWLEVDGNQRLNALPSRQAWLQAARANGLRVELESSEKQVEYAEEALTFLQRIKQTGAQQRTGEPVTTGRRQLAAFARAYEGLRTRKGLPLSWQVLYLVLKA